MRCISGLLLLYVTVALCSSLDTPPQAIPPVRLPEAQALAELRAELHTQSAADKFSGAALIAKGGKPIFQEAYGYADREKKVSNTTGTKFHFGSMGKMFTSVAILQLVQAGKIQLDAPLARYMPDYPNKDVAAVTIHQLLTHTGGTGDIFSPEFFAHRNEMKDLSDYVTLYGKRGLQFPPGSKWEYSNYGFILLGRILEVVSGQSYYDYIREHVFHVAGMSSTDNLPEDSHVPDLAIDYTRGGGGLILKGPVPGAGLESRPGASSEAGPGHLIGPPPGERSTAQPDAPLTSTSGMLPYRGTSAGGGYSTVGGFLAFVNALLSDKLLNAHYTELLTTGKVQSKRPGIKYAYGFEDQLTSDGLRIFGHGGGAPGSNGRLAVLPQSGYVVVVLANLDPPAADSIARFIDSRLPAASETRRDEP